MCSNCKASLGQKKKLFECFPAKCIWPKHHTKLLPLSLFKILQPFIDAHKTPGKKFCIRINGTASGFIKQIK